MDTNRTDPSASDAVRLDRREAIRRVSALLGSVTLVGGSALVTACERAATRDASGSATAASTAIGDFSAADVALLDEVADTILPDTAASPGARAAATGAFMARMVTDAYGPREQQAFRDSLRVYYP